MTQQHLRLVSFVSLVTLPLALLAVPAQALNRTDAAATPASRDQVSMDRNAFVRSHPAPETANWALEADTPWSGTSERTDVKAERDASRLLPRWDADAVAWLNPAHERSVEAPPTREQVRSETREFMRTHQREESAADAMFNGDVGGP